MRSPPLFPQYHRAALRGEKLLDDEAERGIRTWASLAEIARLLLMRRVIWPLPGEHELWRYRVLGAIIPDRDAVVIAEPEKLPTPAKPVLLLHLRPALLAGVAIVERAGRNAPDAEQSYNGRKQNSIRRCRRNNNNSHSQAKGFIADALNLRIRPSDSHD